MQYLCSVVRKTGYKNEVFSVPTPYHLRIKSVPSPINPVLRTRIRQDKERRLEATELTDKNFYISFLKIMGKINQEICVHL